MADIKPVKVDLVIGRGTDWSLTFAIEQSDGTNMPLDGYSVYSQIRTEANEDATLIVAFSTAIDTGTDEFTLSLTDTQTDAVTQPIGYYDIFLVDGSANRYRYAYGTVTFDDYITVIA